MGSIVFLDANGADIVQAGQNYGSGHTSNKINGFTLWDALQCIIKLILDWPAIKCLGFWQ